MLIAVKMALVFALLGGTLWWLRRHDRSSVRAARRGERPVAVLAQTRIGKSASVAVVRIGTEAYAIGVTEQSVSLLVPEPVVLPDPDESTEPDPQTARAPEPTPPRVGDLIRKVGRRSRVQYLDVQLPVARQPATDGSVRGPSARTPEPMPRR